MLTIRRALPLNEPRAEHGKPVSLLLVTPNPHLIDPPAEICRRGNIRANRHDAPSGLWRGPAKGCQNLSKRALRGVLRAVVATEICWELEARPRLTGRTCQYAPALRA